MEVLRLVQLVNALHNFFGNLVLLRLRLLLGEVVPKRAWFDPSFYIRVAERLTQEDTDLQDISVCIVPLEMLQVSDSLPRSTKVVETHVHVG